MTTCILTADNMHTADDCTTHDHEPEEKIWLLTIEHRYSTMTQTELFGEQKCSAPPIESALDDEVRGAYENMTPSERQAVLDKLGVLYGFPYRAYTLGEWLTAYRETL